MGFPKGLDTVGVRGSIVGLRAPVHDAPGKILAVADMAEPVPKQVRHGHFNRGHGRFNDLAFYGANGGQKGGKETLRHKFVRAVRG